MIILFMIFVTRESFTYSINQSQSRKSRLSQKILENDEIEQFTKTYYKQLH